MFTYQTRIHSYSGVSAESGALALSAYSALYGRLERRLFVDLSAGRSAGSLKNIYLISPRIPARMFNALRVSVEGRISAVRAGQARQLASLQRRIARADTQVKRARDRDRFNEAHHKKRRVADLGRRLGNLQEDVRQGRIRLCFGSRRLWRRQFDLQSNGYSSHQEWLGDWRDSRLDEFFVLGSRDEKSGCQLCVATVQDDGSLSLRLRMPECLASEHGRYLVIEGVRLDSGIGR